MSDELVHLDIADQVATITLDSERNRNALSRQLLTELAAHLSTAGAAEQVRVIVLRSASRVFCSGADLSEAAEGAMEAGARAIVDLQRQLATSEKPIVVGLAGPVRAGGLGIVGAADVVIAAESVSFALTEVRLALAPAVISLTLLSRMSERAAAETFLTARTFSAVEAASMGLITRVVPDDQLSAVLDEVTAQIAQGYPQGLAATKKLLNRDLVARIDALADEVATVSAELFNSEQARTAIMAFFSRQLTR